MKSDKRLLVLFCLCMMIVLVACGRKTEHLVDGPDMAYVPQWTKFTISRSDSSTLYSFWFSVSDAGDTAVLTGECSDEEGNQYELTTEIEISGETLWQLRELNLEKLDSPEDWPEDMEIPLDDSTIRLTLVLENGDIIEKNAGNELSFKIYDLLLPYFKK